ncbi:MAG: TetR family transcriptional regulator [Telluria sp.]
MARKTKEDALATRDSILDAAEQLFVTQGVSHTTLQHIATAAGLTRGAIYWHFVDKAALFNALMERAKMPLESAMNLFKEMDEKDPLREVREYTMCVLRLTVDDLRARRAFEIATLKMEFVKEMDAVRGRRMQMHAEWRACVERRIVAGIEHGVLRPDVTPQVASLAMSAQVDGLMRAWLLEPEAFDLVKVGEQVIDMHLDSLRAAPRR